MRDLRLTCDPAALGEVNIDDFLLISPCLVEYTPVDVVVIMEAHKIIEGAVAKLNLGDIIQVNKAGKGNSKRKALESMAVILYNLGLLTEAQCRGGYRFKTGEIGVVYEDLRGACIMVLLREMMIDSVLITRTRAYATTKDSFPQLTMAWNLRNMARGVVPTDVNDTTLPELPLDAKTASMIRAKIHRLTKAITSGDLRSMLSLLEVGDTPRMRLARIGEAVLKLSAASKLTVLTIAAIGNLAYSVCCQVQDGSLIFLLLDRGGNLMEVHLPVLLTGKQTDVIADIS